jgi:acetolactate synthase-1/2/3 large subunit
VARGGHYQANHATRQADILLALGVRFDDRTSSSWIPGYSFTIPPTKLIHVDIDPEEIGRNYPVALGLMADVRTFLRQLHAELDRRADLGEHADARRKWLEAIDGYRKEWDKLVAPGFSDDSKPINPQRAAVEIARGLPEDAILVSDIGVHHNWLLGYCKPRRPDSLIGSMGFGPMGFGVAGVLGAKFAAPDRPCVSVCGDGAFFMHANVLGTAVEYDLPVVWVVWNNYPMRRFADCSAATSAAASWPRTSTTRKPASVTTLTLPPWRAPRASKASASIGPRTWPRL